MVWSVRPPAVRTGSSLRSVGQAISAYWHLPSGFQLFLFGYPYSAATDLLKVDILNCMALAITTIAGLALLQTSQRVHAGVIVGIIIAVASPLISLLPQESHTPGHPHVLRA